MNPVTIFFSGFGLFCLLGFGLFFILIKSLFSSKKSLTPQQRKKLEILESESKVLKERVQVLEYNLKCALEEQKNWKAEGYGDGSDSDEHLRGRRG
jgi:cell division protein FtsB